MALEREYTVPLRREWLKAPRYRRAKRAVSALKQFLRKHMKSEDVKLGKHLNEALWNRGIKNPPARVKIHTARDEDGIIKAELLGKPLPGTEPESKTPEKKENTKKTTSKNEQKPAKKEAEKKTESHEKEPITEPKTPEKKENTKKTTSKTEKQAEPHKREAGAEPK